MVEHELRLFGKLQQFAQQGAAFFVIHAFDMRGMGAHIQHLAPGIGMGADQRMGHRRAVGDFLRRGGHIAGVPAAGFPAVHDLQIRDALPGFFGQRVIGHAGIGELRITAR